MLALSSSFGVEVEEQQHVSRTTLGGNGPMQWMCANKFIVPCLPGPVIEYLMESESAINANKVALSLPYNSFPHCCCHTWSLLSNHKRVVNK